MAAESSICCESGSPPAAREICRLRIGSVLPRTGFTESAEEPVMGLPWDINSLEFLAVSAGIRFCFVHITIDRSIDAAFLQELLALRTRDKLLNRIRKAQGSDVSLGCHALARAKFGFPRHDVPERA